MQLNSNSLMKLSKLILNFYVEIWFKILGCKFNNETFEN